MAEEIDNRESNLRTLDLHIDHDNLEEIYPCLEKSMAVSPDLGLYESKILDYLSDKMTEAIQMDDYKEIMKIYRLIGHDNIFIDNLIVQKLYPDLLTAIDSRVNSMSKIEIFLVSMKECITKSINSLKADKKGDIIKYINQYLSFAWEKHTPLIISEMVETNNFPILLIST